MPVQKLKTRLCKAVDARREQIIQLGREIFSNPELGYREEKTSKLVQKNFEQLGIDYRSGIAVTGVRAEIKGRQSKVKVAILGELDALLCPEHPAADPKTGAAHACGHNAQIASMLGLAMALKDTRIMEELWGDVVFLAVPAEEGVAVEYRQKLEQEGKIKFLGGKQNFIATGQFDDIDLAMGFHSGGNEKKVRVGGTSNGFIKKTIIYKGKEAHAGRPYEGINALNAANLGLAGISAQRETFRDGDHIRIHHIITKGGDVINVVPADVHIDLQLRGANFSAIKDASKKVNRALRAGAQAVGAQVQIFDFPGYMPRLDLPEFIEVFKSNAEVFFNEDEIGALGHRSGSSDIGDVSNLVPTLYPYVNGVRGKNHAKDYSIEDEELAYLMPAKLLGMTLIDLLVTEASLALKLKNNFKPLFSKENYAKVWQDLLADHYSSIL